MEGGGDNMLLKNIKTMYSPFSIPSIKAYKNFFFASDRRRMAPVASLSSSVENQ